MATLPRIYLARHGETAWSKSGQHTGRTDLPLLPEGEENARALGRRLAGLSFGTVLVSPLQRARRTCELAGFGAQAVAEPDLMEWDYGQYEGKKTAEIHAQRPDWKLFEEGCPGGETLEQIAGRADRVVARLRAATQEAIIFSHGHFLRVFAARWLMMAPEKAAHFLLGAGSLSILGYEHDRLEEPALILWNQKP